MRYTSSQNAVSSPETVEVVAKFLTGDTVTVTVYDLEDNSTPSLTSGAASEIGSTGFYKWGSDDIVTQPSSFKQYLVVFEDSTGQQSAQKIVVGGFPDESALNQYGEFIYIDPDNGTAGTAFPIGTAQNPVDNVTDARTIADALGIQAYKIRGAITLDANHNNWTFEGLGSALNDSVAFAGFEIENSKFQDMTVSGAIGGSGTKNITLVNCQVSAVSGFNGVMQDCGIITSLTFEAGTSNFLLRTAVNGLSATVDGNGATSLSWSGAKGIIGITGFTGGVLLLDMETAVITLDSGNTGGSYAVGGVGLFTDNSATMTGLFNEAINAGNISDAVWDEAVADHLTVGSTGEAQNNIDTIITDIAALNDISISDVQTALDNQGYTAARASNLDNLDDSISNVIAAISALNNPSAADIADAVWDELISGHTSPGTFGEKVNRDEVLEETTTIAGSTTSQIRTNLNEANGYWNGTIVEVTLPSGNRVTRVVNSYTLTNGALNVLTTLPETPGTGAAVRILKPVPRLVNSAITASTISASAIGATQLATNAITAAKIAADAIGASELATDAINEIVAAIDAAQVLASTTTIAGSTTTEIRTNLTQADNYWNDHYVEVTLPSGSRVTRAINAYANTNGAITVETLPETPGTGAVVKILRQRGRLSNQGQKDVGIKVQQRLGTLRI